MEEKDVPRSARSITEQHKSKLTRARKSNSGPQQRLESLRDVADKENMEMPRPDSDLWRRAKGYFELPENGSTGPVATLEDWMGGPFRTVVPGYKPYKTNLQDTFRKQGLQAIVKIDSIRAHTR
ncbi:hypothetical protein MAP00_000417 [Monascus purpureus]|nr:hypothetical protein MAP00_000417 [Monascus purpureus]